MVTEYESWAITNAARVFKRRQETKWSFARLAAEFGKSRTTLRAAVRHYLQTHPDVSDEVRLSAGGKRPRRIHVEQFAQEARELWEAGMTKEALAERFRCSTPVVAQALRIAYRRDGLPLLRNTELRAARAAQARKMFDEGHQVEKIAMEMRLSAATIATYVRSTLAAEGKKMPRKRKSRRQVVTSDAPLSDS